MKKRFVVIAVLGAIAILFCSAVSHAAGCTPIAKNQMPYTISSSGNYCLTEYVEKAFSSSAITIAATDVVLDLGGFEIKQQTTGTQTGITVSGTKNNVTVLNGVLTDFSVAVSLNGSVNVLQNITVNHPSGANTASISVSGNGGVISDCRVRGDGTYPDTGIQMRSGSGGRIEKNDVYGAGLEGIYVNQDNAVAQNNVVGNASVISGSSGILVQNANVLLANNRITNMETGIYFASGASAKFRDTMTIGCTYPWTTPLPSGVTSSGGND